MPLLNQNLVYFTLILYAGASVCYFGALKKNILLRLARILTVSGLICNLLILLIRTLMSGRLPLTNCYEFVLSFSFFTLIIYLIYEHKSKNHNAGGTILLVNTLLFLSIILLMNKQINYIIPLMPALKSPWLIIHVITAIIAYSCFTLAAGLAAIEITTKVGKNAEFIYSVVASGFAALSLSIVLGAIWAEQAWSSYWSWDPKETWALITWLIYAFYLHLHHQKGWRGKNANIIVVMGFIIVIFTFFGVNYLLSGLHSYAGL